MLITRRMEFSASYRDREDRTHGHNWVLEVTVRGPIDAETGMVIDLKDLKDLESDAARLALAKALGPVVLKVLTTVPKPLKQRWRKLFEENTLVVTNTVELNMAEAKLFDAHFAGRMGAMTAWEMAHLKFNFLDFLPSKPKSESSEAGGA